MFKKIERYTGRIFLWMLLKTAIFLSFIIFVVEFLEIHNHFPNLSFKEHLGIIGLKIPFTFHKTFSFLIVVTTFLFFIRLMRHQELIAIHSCAGSLWQVLTFPFFITLLFGTLELFIFSDYAHKKLSTYLMLQDKKKTQPQKNINIEKEKNLFFYDKNSFITLYFQPDSKNFKMDMTFFSKNFEFSKRYFAKEISFQGSHLLLQDVWVLDAHRPPVFQKKILVEHPGYTMECKDFTLSKKEIPFFISFYEAHKNIFQKKDFHQWRLSWIHWQQAFSQLVWLISLLFFGAGIAIAPGKSRKQSLKLAVGGFFFFLLYGGGEILYAITLSYHYILSPFLIWVVPVVTFSLAFFMLVKKNEI